MVPRPGGADHLLGLLAHGVQVRLGTDRAAGLAGRPAPAPRLLRNRAGGHAHLYPLREPPPVLRRENGAHPGVETSATALGLQFRSPRVAEAMRRAAPRPPGAQRPGLAGAAPTRTSAAAGWTW